MKSTEWMETPEGQAWSETFAATLEATFGTLGELWDFLPEAPTTLAGMTDSARGRLLVSVRCAVHNVPIAAVLLTPSGKSLLITANETPRLAAESGRFGTWEPTPRSLRDLPQPRIFCPRCRTPRPVPDLDALADQARRTRRQNVRA